MTDSTLKNIEFKTSSATGSTQRSSTGEALSNLIIGSLESANKLADGIYTQQQRELEEQKRIKSENEKQDYLLVLDAKNKIQQKSRELIDSKANAEVYSNELNAYIDSVSNIEFATEEKKLQYSTFANALKEDSTDKKNIYIEDLAIDKATNLLRENINHIDDIEEFYNNTLKGSLYKKNDVEVKTLLYDTYGKSIGTYIEENQDSIIDTLVKKGKQGKNLSQSYIENMYPALKKVGNPTIRKTIEGYTNKLDKVINTKIHYNNVVSIIDRAVDKGDVATLNALRYSQDKETRTITKDMVETELNNVDLNNQEQLSNALKISNIYGVKIDRLENTMASLVNGNITEEQLPEAIGLWNRVKLAGYTPSKDIGDKFDEINAIKSLYSNSGMDEATQWKQSYTTFKEGKKNTKLDVKTINSALESSNVFFGSTPVEGFKEASNSQYETLLVDKVRNVMQYMNVQDTSTIQRIAKEIDKEMRSNAVKVGDKLVPNLGMFGTDEKGKNISQAIVDTYIDSLKEQKYKDIEIDYLNTSTTRGHQFMVVYKNNLGTEYKQFPNLDDIRKDADKHYKYLKSVEDNRSKEEVSFINEFKNTALKQQEEIRKSMLNLVTGNVNETLGVDRRIDFAKDRADEVYKFISEKLEPVRYLLSGDLINDLRPEGKKRGQEGQLNVTNKLIEMYSHNKVSNEELVKMFGINELEKLYDNLNNPNKIRPEEEQGLEIALLSPESRIEYKVSKELIRLAIANKKTLLDFIKPKDIKLAEELNVELSKITSKTVDDIFKYTKDSTAIFSKKQKELNLNISKKPNLDELVKKHSEAVEEVKNKLLTKKTIEIKKEIDNFTGKANSTLGDFNKAKEELEVYSVFKKNWKQILEDRDTFEAFEKLHGNKIGLDLKDSMTTNINKMSEWYSKMDSRLINKKPEEIDGWLDIINKADLKTIFK